MNRTIILLAMIAVFLCSASVASAGEPFANGRPPGPKIQNTVSVFAAGQAAKHGWKSQCATIAGLAYECFLYTPGGSMNTMINGQPAKVTIRADYSVEHSGCRFKIGFSQTNAIPPVMVENGCGASGLRRIRAALLAHG